ncbi:MAG TPA: ergothioneine biosynthesis protein EgtB [Xanthobacteraceae bacterium]|nr:ergothioneine biosynthesis protein EgtB [Xanthobacteraceae bacterium]
MAQTASTPSGLPSVSFAPDASDSASDQRAAAIQAFIDVRAETERRAAPLSPEDQVIQSMPDTSPTKWHRAHTTWFFEQFLLIPYAAGYRPFDERFAFLFNSYYVAAGPRHARPKRGLITRPDVAEVTAYRVHVDAAVQRLVAEAASYMLPDILRVLEIGLNHEQQHQELILTDILHAFAENPDTPVYDPGWSLPHAGGKDGFAAMAEGIRTVGHQGRGFCFDNEQPAHRTLVGPVGIGRGLVTNADWLAFMHDDGYGRPELWLSDGWAIVATEAWCAPGYWRQRDGRWHAMTLAGLVPVDPALPVCHVSYYEADAFARWAGKALPSEAEWEVAARAGELDATFGVVWQWTRSAYSPYPGFRPADGALGEYNGKFMVNQLVLRGSSCATPRGHSRASYRNFFYPAARWQFSGLRLADYSG